MLIPFFCCPHRSQVADFFPLVLFFFPVVHLALSMNSCLKARLVEISIFEKSVLEREAFLLPLAPLLVVKVDISALFEKEYQYKVLGNLHVINMLFTCSYSSVIVLGSSCL